MFIDIIWYSAQEKFNLKEDWADAMWKRFVSTIPQVKEFVTLDGMLCPDFVFEKKNDDWNYVVMNGDYLTDLYTDPIVFLSRNIDLAKYNLIACIKEPQDEDRSILESDYEFIGYDLMDKDLSNSALTNCGGFYDVYSPSDINEYGILSDRDFAYKIRDELFKKHPEEHHANCFVFEIWRMKVAIVN